MTHDIDEDLRQALRRRAASTPRRPDLARACIGRARRIQRRRLTTGVVAAVALVAVAVPLGLRAATTVDLGEPPVAERTDPTQTVPTQPAPRPARTQTTLDLGDLQLGPGPAVPYLDGSTLVVQGRELDLGEPPTVFRAALGSDGIVYHGGFPQGRPSQLQRFSPTEGVLPPLGTVDSGPFASADGRYVLWVLRESETRAVVALDTRTGEEYSLPVGGTELSTPVYPIGVADGTAYLSVKGRVETWQLAEASSSADGSLQDAFVFSPAGTLRSDDLPGAGETNRCSRVVEQSTGQLLWRTCEHTVGGFTSDDRYAWGYSGSRVSQSRGYNVVLDARTGEELLRIEPAPDSYVFGNHLESDDTLLIQYAQQGQVAVVRCTISTGDCELATEPVDGSPDSFPAPYVLEEIVGTG